jgi:hypothetical protein
MNILELFIGNFLSIENRTKTELFQREYFQINEDGIVFHYPHGIKQVTS